MILYLLIIIFIFILLSKKKNFKQIYKFKDIKKLLERDLTYNEIDKNITKMPDFLRKIFISDLRHEKNILFLDILWSLGLFIIFFLILLYTVRNNKTLTNII